MKTIDQARAALRERTTKLGEYATQRAKIENDKRLTPQARAEDLQNLEAGVGAEIRQLERSAADLGAKAADELATERRDIMRLAKINPATPDEWTQANGRASFFREDVEQLAGTRPQEIVDMFNQAVNARDNVTKFLTARYGVEALKKGNNLDLAQTLSELIAAQEQPNGTDLQRLQQSQAELDEAQTEIRAIAVNQYLSATYKAPSIVG